MTVKKIGNYKRGEIGTLAHLHITGMNVKWYSHIENSLAVLQKIQHKITLRSSNCTPEYIVKRIENWHSNIYLTNNVHCSIIHSAQKVEITECPSKGELISKMYYIYSWNIIQP